MSTDPYLFGNGANLEHFINFFAVASLAFFVRGWDRADRWCLVGSGVCVGAAALIKQVAILPAFVFAAALVYRAWSRDIPLQRKIASGLIDVVSFGLGLAAISTITAAILLGQGAGAAAYDDIFRYGRALATDTLPEPNAPHSVIRWITGNADPAGRLPWPFGVTDYLVWWGTASWPFWLASIPALAVLLLGPRKNPLRRLAAFWTLAAWAQVALPGLYWPHYYLLPVAGSAIAIAVCWADAGAVLSKALGLLQDAGSTERPPESSDGIVIGKRPPVRPSVAFAADVFTLMTMGIGTTLFLEVRDYLFVPPQELTIRYKGGRQWVVLRDMGREIARRTASGTAPPAVHLGLAEPAALLLASRQSHAAFFCRQSAPRSSGSQPSLDRAKNRGDRRGLETRAPRTGLHGLSPVPRSASVSERALSAVANGSRPLDPARCLRTIRGSHADDPIACQVATGLTTASSLAHRRRADSARAIRP